MQTWDSIIDITFSLFGAIRIALGITLAMVVMPGVHSSIEVQPLVANRFIPPGPENRKSWHQACRTFLWSILKISNISGWMKNSA